MAPRYKTDEERIAARRKTWREVKQRQRDEYRELCAEAGVWPSDCGGVEWKRHYEDLKKKRDMRWWLDRFSLEEIREMAGAMEDA